MGDTSELQKQINPILSKSEFESLLNPSTRVIDSPAKIQRDKLLEHIRTQSSDIPDELLGVLTEFVRWKNGNTGIALWAGYLDRADNMRKGRSSFGNIEQVEYSLLERIAQPAYNKTDLDKDNLVDVALVFFRSSALTQFRPAFWADDELATTRVENALENTLKILF